MGLIERSATIPLAHLSRNSTLLPRAAISGSFSSGRFGCGERADLLIDSGNCFDAVSVTPCRTCCYSEQNPNLSLRAIHAFNRNRYTELEQHDSTIPHHERFSSKHVTLIGNEPCATLRQPRVNASLSLTLPTPLAEGCRPYHLFSKSLAKSPTAATQHDYYRALAWPYAI